MNKYGPKGQEKVHKAMHEYEQGELYSGKSGKKVADLLAQQLLKRVMISERLLNVPQSSGSYH